jgi:signal transduction histidine kinase
MPELRPWQRRSLRTRIVAFATVAVMLVLVAGGWLLTSALRQALVDDLARAAALRSQDLATLATQGSLPRPIPIGDADEALVQVVAGGRVVAASDNATDQPALELEAPPPGTTTVTDVASLPITDDEDEGGFLVAATSVTTPDVVLTVYVASSLEDVEETLEEAARLGLLALPVLIILLAGGIWLLVGRTLAPVDAIRGEAEAITGSDLHRRVPEPAGEDEIGRLAHTLNRMLGRLEGSADRQRRFVADAAHELRTPVASIRTTLETARSSPRRIDWDEVSGDVLADTVRMQQLIEQLLLVARVDAGRLAERMQVVDLDDLVSQAIARHEPESDVEVEVEAAHLEPLQATGEPILLGQVVRNLVDNATAHATTRVEIALRQDEDTAALTVDDDGPGIPAERRDAVFERFTRLDDARTRHRTGGAGLGLAIVADIVAAHGGTVHAGDSPLGGARLTVHLPRPEPDGPSDSTS